MSMSYEQMLAKYEAYAQTPEAHAVLFVKRYLSQADDSVWIDILDYAQSERCWNNEFLMVKCELFPREHVPVYPKRKEFDDKKDYIAACRALTWQVANSDIETYRARGTKGRVYMLRGRVDKGYDRRGRVSWIDHTFRICSVKRL